MISPDGKFDTNLFCKSFKNDINVVQIYLDDIIFGFANAALCKEFSKSMQAENPPSRTLSENYQPTFTTHSEAHNSNFESDVDIIAVPDMTPKSILTIHPFKLTFSLHL